MYSELAAYYDRIYWWKDYKAEVDFLCRLFREKNLTVRRILEVACGTGSHTELLAERGYEVTGLDISGPLLSVARAKVKRKASFVHGDMRRLGDSVESGYDAVLCLFSAVCYNTTAKDLKRTLRGFHNALRPGGVAVFDTHFTKKSFMDGFRDETAFDDGETIGVRISTSKRRKTVGELSFTYLVKDGPKVLTVRDDVHRLGLFDEKEYIAALRGAGFAKARVYRDWSFKPTRRTAFSDSIFVAFRPV